MMNARDGKKRMPVADNWQWFHGSLLQIVRAITSMLLQSMRVNLEVVNGYFNKTQSGIGWTHVYHRNPYYGSMGSLERVRPFTTIHRNELTSSLQVKQS